MQALVSEKAEEEVGPIATVKALSESGSGNYLGSVEGSEVEREARGTGALGDRARTDVALGHEQRALLPVTSQVTPINRPCPKANDGSQRAPPQYGSGSILADGRHELRSIKSATERSIERSKFTGVYGYDRITTYSRGDSERLSQ